MCIRGLISHAGGSRDYGASGGVRHVYHCFTEISVKCTNSKCSPCKCTWLLGSCGNCVEASDSDISWSLCKDTFRSTVPWPPCLQSATGVFGSCWWTPGGAARDPREPWELCDCDSILSIWWLCQGTPVDTVGSGNSRHQRVMPSAQSTSPKPSLFIDSKTTGGRKPLLDKVL